MHKEISASSLVKSCLTGNILAKPAFSDESGVAGTQGFEAGRDTAWWRPPPHRLRWWRG